MNYPSTQGKRQAKELRRGGRPVLLRKSVHALGLCLAVLPVLLVIALRPLVLIRFRILMSNRMGHFARNTELYLCERDLEMGSRRTLDIFFHTPPVCNQQLKKMWERTLHVSRFARWPYRLISRLPGFKAHIGHMPSDRDVRGLLRNTQPHLSFTAEEDRLGTEAFRRLGIPEGTPFVCFHARDSAYLNTVYPGSDLSGHDYQDADIHSYVPAMEELVRRDHFSLRMGSVVNKPLNNDNSRIIDYASNGRSDFLDMYLAAKCRFFIGGSSGLESVPAIFRRPIALVNQIPLEYAHTWGPHDLFIPKKLWLRKDGRFLTFSEILNLGIGRFLDSDLYESLDIKVIQNEPEEVTALAVEMDERLKGTWETTEDDVELQRRFWSLFKPSELHGKVVSRIGAEFLRQNRHLLGSIG